MNKIHCEIRLNDEKETVVGSMKVDVVPRVGEYIKLVTNSNVRTFEVKEVWHFVSVSQTVEIALYVNSTGK